MKNNEYSQIRKHIFRDMRNADYEKALQTLNDLKPRIPDAEFEIDYMRIYCLLKLAEYETAKGIIRKNLNKGNYFDFNRECFDSIRNNEEFEIFERINNSLVFSERKKHKSKSMVFLPKEYGSKLAYPMIVILHGEGLDGRAEKTFEMWPPDEYLKKGYIVAYFQSEYPSCKNNYGWHDDLPGACECIKMLYYDMLEDYFVDEGRVYIFGFSGGAAAALYTAAKTSICFRGMVLQSLPEITLPILNSVEIMKIRKCVFLLLEGENAGEENAGYQQKIIEMFDRNGIKNRYLINEGYGNEIPKTIVDTTLSCDFLEL